MGGGVQAWRLVVQVQAWARWRQVKLDELSAAGALLLGRVTYEGFAKAWPSVKDEEGFGDKMNGIRKYVVSNKLKDSEATWNNTTIIRSDMAAEVARLKAQPGGDLLVYGSARLAQDFAQHGLVDGYRLMVYPVLLGGGKRLFADAGQLASLELVDSKAAGDGIVMLDLPGRLMQQYMLTVHSVEGSPEPSADARQRCTGPSTSSTVNSSRAVRGCSRVGFTPRTPPPSCGSMRVARS